MASRNALLHWELLGCHHLVLKTSLVAVLAGSHGVEWLLLAHWHMAKLLVINWTLGLLWHHLPHIDCHIHRHLSWIAHHIWIHQRHSRLHANSTLIHAKRLHWRHASHGKVVLLMRHTHARQEDRCSHALWTWSWLLLIQHHTLVEHHLSLLEILLLWLLLVLSS